MRFEGSPDQRAVSAHPGIVPYVASLLLALGSDERDLVKIGDSVCNDQ